VKNLTDDFAREKAISFAAENNRTVYFESRRAAGLFPEKTKPQGKVKSRACEVIVSRTDCQQCANSR
jgi:hypothetical protein